MPVSTSTVVTYPTFPSGLRNSESTQVVVVFQIGVHQFGGAFVVVAEVAAVDHEGGFGLRGAIDDGLHAVDGGGVHAFLVVEIGEDGERQLFDVRALIAFDVFEDGVPAAASRAGRSVLSA